jgi:hypothetical protein
MSEEEFCVRTLAALHKEYTALAKPFIDRLVAIRSTQLTPFLYEVLNNDHQSLPLLQGSAQP